MEPQVDEHEEVLTTEQPDAGIGGRGFSRRNRNLLYAFSGIFLLTIIGMFAWKVMAVRSLEEQFSQAEARHTEARIQLLGQARRLDARKDEESLRLFSIPFGWAVRREMMAGNLDQVDQYFTGLVQTPGFEAATLAAPDGKILVASDRKRLGQTFASIYPERYLQSERIEVERETSGRLRAIIPILGLNLRLGMAVVEFKPSPNPLQ
jgi:hypothetical protein